MLGQPGDWHVKRSCSWCHELNEIQFRYCATCGHEAHVPRAHCVCSQCRELHWQIPAAKDESVEVTELKREIERDQIRSRMRDA